MSKKQGEMTGNHNRKQWTEINPLRGERLRTIINEVGCGNKGLADLVDCTPEHISQVICGHKNLTEKLARKTVSVFPQYRLEWLLGLDDFKSQEEYIRKYSGNIASTHNAILKLMDWSLTEVCLRENIERPEIPTGDLLFLSAQIQDFSDALMWNYINHSRVWEVLDLVDAATSRAKKEEDNNG